MRFPITLAIAIGAIVAACAPRIAQAQIKMVVHHKRAEERVVAIYKGVPVVRAPSGKSERVGAKAITFSVDDHFAEGFVEIKYDAPQDTAARRRLSQIRPTFQIDAIVTADRDLKECALVYAFPSDGAPSTFVERIGNLKAGAPRRVAITVGAPVDGKGFAHVLSQGREVRSTESAAPGQSVSEQVQAAMPPRESEPVRELVQGDEVHFTLRRDGACITRLEPRGLGRSLLTILDASTGASLASTMIGNGRGGTARALWLEGDSCIVHHGDELFRVDFGEGEAGVTLLRDRVSLVEQPVPDRPEIVSVRRHERIDYYKGDLSIDLESAYERINCLTGEISTKEALALPKGYRMHEWTDASGAPVLISIYEERQLRYQARVGDSWIPLSELNREPGLLFPGDAKLEAADRSATILGMTDNEDEIFIASNHNSDRIEIARYSLATGRVTQTVARNALYDVEPLPGYGTPLRIDRRTRELLALAYRADFPRVAVLDADLQVAQSLIESVYPDFTHIPSQWSEDRRRVIYRSINAARTDSMITLVDGSTGKVAPLVPPPSDEALAKRGRTVLRRVAARDGYSLDAYLTLPPGRIDGPLPIVALPFDRLGERAHGAFDATNQFFATRGYLVVRVNHRGCNGYGKEHYRAGLDSGLDGFLIDDLADVVRALVRSGEGRSDSVAIVGKEVGGYSVFMSLIEYADLYTIGVSAFGFEDLQDDFNDRRSNLPEARYYGTTLAYHVARIESDRDYARRVSPARRAAEIRAPLLVIKDWSVHNRGSGVRSEVYNKLKKQGVPCELTPFVRPGYFTLDSAATAQLLTTMETFLARHAPASPRSGSREASDPSAPL